MGSLLQDLDWLVTIALLNAVSRTIVCALNSSQMSKEATSEATS